MPDAPSGDWLTSQLRRAEQHAQNVEPLLEAALTALLEQFADQAAAGFARHAVDFTAVRASGETALAGAAASAQSTMICVKPTPEQAAALALNTDGAEAVDVLHVTLVYLGETVGPLTPIVEALRPVAMRHASLAGIVGGFGSFMDAGDGYPVLALPNVPGLVELRVDVTQALTDAGIDYARNHGYCPHMTLAYAATPTFVEEAAGQPLTFPELLIVRGDTEVVPLPFSGRPPITASVLSRSALERADGFTDADNPPRCDSLSAWGMRCSFPAGHDGSHFSALDPPYDPPDAIVPIVIRVAADRARVPVPGAPGWHADMRGVDRLLDRLKAEDDDQVSDLLDELAAVAEKHAPEGGYGYTYWNADTGAVFWVCGDWTETVEADAAEADFLAIDGVNSFEACWECAPPGTWYDEKTRETHYGPGDGWEQVYAAARWTMAAVTAPLLYQRFADSQQQPPAGWAAPAPTEILDVDAVVAAITARIRPVRDAAVAAAAAPVLNQVGIDYDITNPLVGHVLAQAGSQVTNIADTTQLNVMRIVRRSYEEGLSIPHTAEAIREGMREAAPARARLIARTELAGAVNGGSLAAVRIVSTATGTTYKKVWMTAPGAKTPRHYLYDGLNGQARTLSGTFDVGMSALDHPGDPEGPPREICNCRCAMRYSNGSE